MIIMISYIIHQYKLFYAIEQQSLFASQFDTYNNIRPHYHYSKNDENNATRLYVPQR